MSSRRSRHNGLSHAEDFAAEIVDDPDYRRRLKERAKAGELAPPMEVALLHYRWGKPIERLAVSTDEDLSALSREDLMKLAVDLQLYLRDLPDEEEPNVAAMPVQTGSVN